MCLRQSPQDEDVSMGEPYSEWLWHGVSGTPVSSLSSAGEKRNSVFKVGKIYTQREENTQ